MLEESTDTFSKIIARSASILFSLGLLTGIHVTMVATGAINGDLGASLAAHLNGIIGSMVILSLYLILPNIRYGNSYKLNMIRLFVVANYANWLITLIKSVLHVRALELMKNSPANNAVHIALVIFVVIPSLIGAGMWVYDLFKSD